MDYLQEVIDAVEKINLIFEKTNNLIFCELIYDENDITIKFLGNVLLTTKSDKDTKWLFSQERKQLIYKNLLEKAKAIYFSLKLNEKKLALS